MRVLTSPVEPAHDLGRFLDAFVVRCARWCAGLVRDVVRFGCSVEPADVVCVYLPPCRELEMGWLLTDEPNDSYSSLWG
jgi:hypothetical protein